MAFDGIQWLESRPDNNDLANEIDDYMRDDKIAVRSRMAHEHVWPASQAATNQGGFHTFITFQGQTSAPILVYGTSTQRGAIWCSSGTNNFLIEDSAGTSHLLVKSGVGIVFFGGTGDIGAIPYVTSGGGFSPLAAATSGYVLVAQGTNTAAAWVASTSLSTNKVTAFVNGDRVERGQGNVGLSTTTSVAFGTPFASTPHITLVAVNMTGVLNDYIGIQSKSAGGFTMRNANGTTITFDWIAIGSA